jgi:hypothetical protein
VEYTHLEWTTTAVAPTVRITKLPGGEVALEWPFGTLLEATNVTGPWTTNSTATSRYTNTLSGQKKFFRAQYP